MVRYEKEWDLSWEEDRLVVENVDLFTAQPHTEILTLEEVADGGWSMGSGEPADVAEATLTDNRNETATLTVTARKKGSTTLTIRNGNEEIVITVNVTTQLELRPTSFSPPL